MINEPDSELLAAVLQVTTAFEALGVDYLIGGSVASSVFGEPRQTLDADLVACVLGKHVRPLSDALSNGFYLDEGAVRSAIERQSSFNLIHLETMTKVDVFISWRRPFGQSQLSRRLRVGIGGRELFFATPEDTILAKLEWFNKGGRVSDRQWRDILGVLKVQAQRLDFNYLDSWANQLEVADLLRKARGDATG